MTQSDSELAVELYITSLRSHLDGGNLVMLGSVLVSKQLLHNGIDVIRSSNLVSSLSKICVRIFKNISISD